MNKAERDELRRIIRQRTKVLRADIEARQAELISEVDRRLDEQYAAELKRWDDTQMLVKEVVGEANRRANDLYREYFGSERWGERHDRTVVSAAIPESPKRGQNADRSKAIREIDAKVAQARTELERREVALLEELAIGALESADARDFLSRIPTVGELVPSHRLTELVDGSSG